ncbi:V-set and immunoglobulin domain-containing protein 4-like isoform X4 [Polypterus senegalus]|uniref:V-set and immunoglobulin domain-containing protein 4-like isoform X4 n=1 Tax=Polypterus senegalus TaxID=55291 RepID=UPI0019628606|nr:V-set and immunoglobulin domain-containing protein 4-like isoform X4 [Polypterus senegalus]
MSFRVWLLIILVQLLLLGTLSIELISIKEITVLWGSDLTIPCSYQPTSSYSENRLKWTIMQSTREKSIFSRHGDESIISLLEYRGRASVPDISTVGNVSLTLTKVTFEDRGDYICEVDLRSEDGQITPLSAHTKIIILRVPVSKPVITNVMSPHTIFDGEALRMYCTTSGSPPVKYRWYKKKSDGFEQVMELTGSLSIRHATLSDSGEYYCTAENKAPEVINRKSDPVLVTVLALYDLTSQVFETDKSTVKDAVTVYPSSSRASIITSKKQVFFPTYTSRDTLSQYDVTSQLFETNAATDKVQYNVPFQIFEHHNPAEKGAVTMYSSTSRAVTATTHLRSSLATVIFITLISAVALAVLISLAICIYMRKKKGKKKFGYNSAPLDNAAELKNLNI